MTPVAFSPEYITDAQLAEHFDQVEGELSCYGHPHSVCRSWARGETCERCLAGRQVVVEPYAQCELCAFYDKRNCPLGGVADMPFPKCSHILPRSTARPEPRGDRDWQNANKGAGLPRR